MGCLIEEAKDKAAKWIAMRVIIADKIAGKFTATLQSR